MKIKKIIPQKVNFYLFIFFATYCSIFCSIILNLKFLGVSVYVYYITGIFSFTQEDFWEATYKGTVLGVLSAVGIWILTKYAEIQRKKAAKQPPQQE